MFIQCCRESIIGHYALLVCRLTLYSDLHCLFGGTRGGLSDVSNNRLID